MIVIKSMYLNNFKVFRNQEFKFNPGSTAIIGPNGSGKTTILEALHSFSCGIISEDMLRSDSAFPEISCYFEFEEKFLKDYLDMEKIPTGLKKKLQKKKGIWLERSWKNLSTAIFRCSDEEIVEFYKDVSEADQHRIETIHRYIQKFNNETNDLRLSLCFRFAPVS